MVRPHVLCMKMLVLAAILAFNSPAHAQPIRVPGTGVRIAPPTGFVRAEQFPGFAAADRGASIMVTEIPGPVAEVRKGMTREGLASRGMTLIESRSVKLGGGEGLLLRVSQVARGLEYFKWMLVGGTSQRTVMVVGAFPSDATDLSEPIRRSLLTVSWTGMARADLFEGLAFRVDATPEMRLAERMGNMLILSESGTISPGNPDMAILVVGGSLGGAEIRDLEGFSKERVTQIDRMEHVQVRTGSAIVVDSLAGYEMTAEGNDRKTQHPVGLYQLLLADGNTYYIAQGFVASRRMAELLPVFRRVMNSFQRTVETGPSKITR